MLISNVMAKHCDDHENFQRNALVLAAAHPASLRRRGFSTRKLCTEFPASIPLRSRDAATERTTSSDPVFFGIEFERPNIKFDSWCINKCLLRTVQVKKTFWPVVNLETCCPPSHSRLRWKRKFRRTVMRTGPMEQRRISNPSLAQGIVLQVLQHLQDGYSVAVSAEKCSAMDAYVAGEGPPDCAR